MLTTTQAAAELGITPTRLRAFIRADRLKAYPNPHGTARLIKPRDLDALRNLPTGRPRKLAKGAGQ